MQAARTRGPDALVWPRLSAHNFIPRPMVGRGQRQWERPGGRGRERGAGALGVAGEVGDVAGEGGDGLDDALEGLHGAERDLAERALLLGLPLHGRQDALQHRVARVGAARHVRRAAAALVRR
eukprot:3631377-Rhodomonas_salina.3